MARGVVRGCGVRQPGGIYLVSEVGEKGKPLPFFLIDPPRVIDPEAVGLQARGVTLTTLGGEACVLDWVGSDYPNVADFLEEIVRFGSSRRVQRTFDFAALKPGARHLFVHPRAHIDNAAEFREHFVGAFAADTLVGRYVGEGERCVTRRPAHQDNAYWGMCATRWWQDLDPATAVYSTDEGIFEQQMVLDATVKRVMPGFAYHAYRRPEGVECRYRPAAFLWLPVHRIEVVADPEGGADREALHKASVAGLPVTLEEE